MAEFRRLRTCRRAVAGALTGATAATLLVTAAPAARAEITADGVSRDWAKAMCMGSFVRARADDATTTAAIMGGSLALQSHPATPLPVNPTWAENPFGDRNWQFQYLSLDWLDRLRREGLRTGDAAVLDRWQALLKDSLADVPTVVGADTRYWMDMALSIRAIEISCAIAELGRLDWLLDGVQEHGDALASESLYSGKGNHAMHQNNGLLALGLVAGRQDWVDLAMRRQNVLLERSIDSQGVIDEGSVGYQWHNYVWWIDSRDRVKAAGLPLSSVYARIPRMLELLAHVTGPDQRLEMIGDTGWTRTPAVPGTVTEYAAKAGASGPKPAYLTRVYRAGYAIGRSSWERADFAGASHWTMRFGPPVAEQVHAHDDHGSITFSSHGNRLLWDQGYWAYTGGPMRDYVRSAGAHNRITVKGASKDRTAGAPLVTHKDTSAYTLVTADIRSLKGIRWIRTLFYSKRGRYLLVDDRVTRSDGSTAPLTATQRFHLGTDRELVVRGGTTHTSGPGADLGIFQLGTVPTARVVRGQADPLMGWRSTAYKVADPAPVLESQLTGTTVRFSTALIPRGAGASATSISVSRATQTRTDVTVTVTAGAVKERVTLSRYGAVVTRVA